MRKTSQPKSIARARRTGPERRTPRAKAAPAVQPLAIDRAAGGALVNAVADAIVEAIAQGSFEPGQRLVEADLAAQLEVSRVPVREATRMLQAQGVLKVLPGQGARVSSFGGPVADQVNEARIALERIAIRHAAAVYAAEPRRLDGLRAIVSRMERAARWEDWTELRRADVAFHHEICRLSGNEIVLSLWEALARRITIIFGREIAAERRFDVVIRQHKRLIEMFEKGSPGLEEEIESHIERLKREAEKRRKGRKAKG